MQIKLKPQDIDSKYKSHRIMVGRARIKASNHIAIKQRYLLQVVSLTLVKGKAMTMSRSTARTRIVKIRCKKRYVVDKIPCMLVSALGCQETSDEVQTEVRLESR